MQCHKVTVIPAGDRRSRILARKSLLAEGGLDTARVCLEEAEVINDSEPIGKTIRALEKAIVVLNETKYAQANLEPESQTPNTAWERVRQALIDVVDAMTQLSGHPRKVAFEVPQEMGLVKRLPKRDQFDVAVFGLRVPRGEWLLGLEFVECFGSNRSVEGPQCRDIKELTSDAFKQDGGRVARVSMNVGSDFRPPGEGHRVIRLDEDALKKDEAKWQACDDAVTARVTCQRARGDCDQAVAAEKEACNRADIVATFPTFEGDECISVRSDGELDGVHRRRDGHAMLGMGMGVEKESGKAVLILQNWWERFQYGHVERDYVEKHQGSVIFYKAALPGPPLQYSDRAVYFGLEDACEMPASLENFPGEGPFV